MKRSRNDQIVTVVNQYLKHRQYMDSLSEALKPERRCVHSAREHIAACTVLNNGSTELTVSYSSASSDPGTWDIQFIRFRCYVEEAVEPYRLELGQLLFPVYVHIYLELLCVGHKLQAHLFGERYRFLFANIEEELVMLSTLSTLITASDVITNKVTREFRECKYQVMLTENAFLHLSTFLKNEDNVVILQIISQRMDILVIDGETNASSATVDEIVIAADGDLIDPLLTSPLIPETKHATDVNLGALARITQKIDQSSPPLPSICLFTLINAYQGLLSVCVSPDERSLSAGFEDSRLAIWSLVPKPLPMATKLSGYRVSDVSLAGDCPEDVEERLSMTKNFDTSSPDCATFRGHSGSIYSTCFLPDGTHVLSASEDKTVRLWDISKRSNVVCYRGHNYPVYCVEVSPIASFFGTCSYDETAKLWSTDRVFPLRTFIGHTRSVNCVRFHPNGNYLATGSSDSTVRLWSLQDAQPVRLMHGHRGMVMTLAFSPSGKYLASAGEDRRVKIWDLSTGSLLRDLRGHTDFIYSLAFSHDSQTIASGGIDGIIRLWETNRFVDDSSSQSGDSTSSSSSLLGSFPTKSFSVLNLQFSKQSFLVASGAVS